MGQYLLSDFKGSDGKMHRGIIDKENEYMAIRADDYPGAAEKLSMFNFRKFKTAAYDATANAINQGLVIFPSSLNIRNEIEFEETNADGSMYIRYEKPNLEEVMSLIEFDLAKEELMGMAKTKRPNGTIVYDQTPQAKSNNLHDDRADCIAMACYRLMQLRAQEALDIEVETSDFSRLYTGNKNKKGPSNPFYDGRSNPFANSNNPFK